MTARQDERDFKKELGVDRWVGDLDERRMLERLGARPSINIDGLVAGYTGPGSKTILPQRALAKIDIRLVPRMTARDVLAKLRAHLDRRGYRDLAIRSLGSYDPNETSFDSLPVQVHVGLCDRYKVAANVTPRGAGSWPGYLFTGDPVRRPAIHVGMGYGDGAHSKDEFYVVEPPPGAPYVGLAGAIGSFADYLYAIAGA
jgi:acetylornithine deacetylase/succinyl-diaminopimelate desuccinylase-like protein